MLLRQFIRLQDDVLSVKIQIGERSRNDLASLCTEVILVEDDVVSVYVFESLLRLKRFSEDIGGDEI